ncbi:hypothetical protein [Primorskyibacter sp. S87]|uniref:hypothetical protein n=1 Tax=Primorskyibacter sp. S87 TaxID=3415126 RepID=UPI003C7AD58D
MNLNLSRRSVQLAGRNAAGIPGNIDVSDGYVTAAEFRQIFEAGNRAYSIGVGRN